MHINVHFIFYKYNSGLYATPFTLISKWQCDPYDLPVFPAFAIS